uniref:RRM domain-containing protein n=1 Tax=Fibrocapsa japonica TaxID=94617 RepID=A0A7S2V5R1_9STRA|mmetsp:Transcript_8637/g.13260  ORF Transcript_8637/g.13260 Transcript_8637/m.13260 type:complete len:536 (+) Transcript_8637:51-1658(+)
MSEEMNENPVNSGEESVENEHNELENSAAVTEDSPDAGDRDSNDEREDDKKADDDKLDNKDDKGSEAEEDESRSRSRSKDHKRKRRRRSKSRSGGRKKSSKKKSSRRHRSRSGDRKSRRRRRRRSSRSSSGSRSRSASRKKTSKFSAAPTGFAAAGALGVAALGTPGAAANPLLAGLAGMPAMPGVAGLAGLGGIAGMPVQADKAFRELFVGNTPPGTSELVLMEFLNAALNQVKLTTAPGNPIIGCRVSNKFAFIELRSAEETNNCLSLNGIPFMGQLLKIGRPTKYCGPVIQASTWQALTGQQAPEGASVVDPSTKLYRELYIGSTTAEMTELGLQEFLGTAMQQVGLTLQEGNPIVQVRHSGTFAFVELRSIEEANNCLNLNSIPFMGQFLKIGRPSKYPGPQVPHLNWEDVLAKYMAGEMPTAGGPQQQPSRVIALSNMVTTDELMDDTTYQEIVEDTRDECGKYGAVQSMEIPRPGAPHGVGKVFIEFTSTADAAKAIGALKGRTFAGNKVDARYFPESKYQVKDLSDDA